MKKINDNKRFMLDIETLGCSGSPVILQIACANFDLSKTLNLKLDKTTQHKSSIDKATVEWWGDKEMPQGELHIREAVDKLRNFLVNAKEVWSHNFDCNILFSVADTYNLKIPYHYTRFRDIRTLVALSNINLDSYDWNEKTHDALDDVKFQIKYCKDAIDSI